MSDTVRLRVEKAVYGGDGLARLPDGRAVFVPMTLPGEMVESRMVDAHRGVARAEVVEIVEPVDGRTPPRCKHYGICGGCHYQHATYELQLMLKREVLRDTMQRAGVSAPEIQVHAGEPWGYRNRIRLHFLRETDGRLRLGYKRRRTNDAFALQECPIAAPVLVRAAAALAESTTGAPWADAADEAELFCNERGQVMVAVLLAPGVRATGATETEFDAAMARLQRSLPDLAGAGLYRQSSRAGQPPTEIAGWGADELDCSVGGQVYGVNRGAFFQVNAAGAAQLMKIVAGDRQGALAWDLYAGVGLFSVALSRRFMRVVAVESAAAALGSLRENLRAAGEQHRALENTTVEFLRRTAAPSSKKPPQLVVADPPRAGLGAEVCKLLALVGPAEMVYVSCDPVTLGRDLAALIESGYRLRALHLVDLFAQTFHMETVAELARV